ncbi:hypothetical protein SCLCIDRAFT_138621 [Scleroderma citrinum Foug A]|uniref:Chromo domain-containing protein n=1 Tax=Scleroderma citrinum Foug A TaxID=1036808 RepID=A0A0C3CYJ7_9AGAM|nr:hypothetical protein SCLCIDRAFT_138621 [Scleroderma citrinum Foug A]
MNVSHVKPYLGPLPGQPVSQPGPVQVSEERDEEYEVDYIVASHIYGRQLQYLVHWKGYEEHEHTWEPASNLDFDSLFKPVPENLTICDAQFCSLESCS